MQNPLVIFLNTNMQSTWVDTSMEKYLKDGALPETITADTLDMRISELSAERNVLEFKLNNINESIERLEQIRIKITDSKKEYLLLDDGVIIPKVMFLTAAELRLKERERKASHKNKLNVDTVRRTRRRLQSESYSKDIGIVKPLQDISEDESSDRIVMKKLTNPKSFEV